MPHNAATAASAADGTQTELTPQKSQGSKSRRRAARLPAHPPPPRDIARRALPLVEATGPWLRIHRIEHEPLFFGRTGRYRFDAPHGEYGVLYAAADVHSAFVETFGWRTGERVIDLVDLAAAGLTRLGADARLSAGESYATARRWALALWRHPAQPDGLHYRARHDPSRYCIALYDRAAPAVVAVTLGALAAPEHAALLAEVLATYEFGLADEPL